MIQETIVADPQFQGNGTDSSRSPTKNLIPRDDPSRTVLHNWRLAQRLSVHFLLGFGIYVVLFLGILFYTAGFMDMGATTSDVARLYPALTTLVMGLLTVYVIVMYGYLSRIPIREEAHSVPARPLLLWSENGPVESDGKEQSIEGKLSDKRQ